MLLVSATHAQPPEEPEPQVPAEPVPPQGPWTVEIGVGALEFAGDQVDAAVDAGAAWELRVGYRTNRLVGVEASAFTASNDITEFGLDPDADLDSLAIEAVAHFNFEEYLSGQLGPVLLAPFAFVGLGYQRVNLDFEGINTSNLAQDSDNLLVIPIGVGLGARWGRIIADTRLTWRETSGDDMFPPPPDDDHASMAQWMLSLRAGVHL